MSLKVHSVGTFVVLALTFLPMTATAGPLQTFGHGKSAAMGNAGTASADGVSAAHYNMAGLAQLERPTLTIGAFTTYDQLQIRLKPRPSGYDIPLLRGSQALPTDAEPRSRRDVESVGALHMLTIGGVTPIGSTPLRLGMLVVLPTSGLFDLRTHFPDERERYFSNELRFELLDHSLRRVDVRIGASARLTDRLAFGVGGTYLPGVNLATDIYLQDPADQSSADVNANIATENQWAPIAGLLARLPLFEAELGVQFRGPVSFQVEGANLIRIRGADEAVEQPVDWVPVYAPAVLSMGLARQTGAWLFALDGQYTFWSTYRNTHGERAGFSNTLSGHFGASYTQTENTELRFGSALIPSPVSAQVGRTNYVDNTRLMVSVGGGHNFQLFDTRFQANWFLQFHHLFTRDTDKVLPQDGQICRQGVQSVCDEVPDDLTNPQTGQPFPEAQGLQIGNPGFPGFASGGWMGVLGFELVL